MNYRAKDVWIQTYPHPIDAKAGEKLILSDKDPEFAGWVWAKDSHHREGWVPLSYLKVEGSEGILTRDYSALELTVVTGDEVEALTEESGWAWCKNANGFQGWVPLSCLEPVA